MLRRKILSGIWVPGQRLPTHQELLAELGVSKTTMQRAVDCLTADGFIETRGSRGTFVAQRPPHLSEYALVFHGTPEDPPSWGRFSQVLSASAEMLQRTSEKKFPQFCGISGHPDAEDYQNLLRSLRSQRLAGLIFASIPHHLVGDPILEQPGIPRVAFMSAYPDLLIPAVEVDMAAFCDRAVDFLADHGRERIAALFYAGGGSARHDVEDFFLSALQRRGLTQRPCWRQYVNVFHPTAVCRTVDLLLQADQPQRPDALIVMDDTMVDAVVNGLFAAGVSVPRDVEVVAHANFPVTQTPMPIQRLGFDSRKVLQTCVHLIDQQRRGEPAAPVTRLPPLFENEIEETVTA